MSCSVHSGFWKEIVCKWNLWNYVFQKWGANKCVILNTVFFLFVFQISAVRIWVSAPCRSTEISADVFIRGMFALSFFALHKVTMCASEINLCWFRKNGDNLAYLFTLISIDFWFCKSQFVMSFCMPLHNYFCCDLLALLSDLVLQWRNICLFSIINVHVWMCIDHVPSWYCWYLQLWMMDPF